MDGDQFRSEISPEKVVAELYAAHKNEKADPLLNPASKKLFGMLF